ncbi:Uncharacterized protein QTN25_000200 [Entamoeba marina]
MSNNIIHDSIIYTAFGVLSNIHALLKESPLYDLLQLNQAYSSQDQEYEKNEFYGDSYLEERVSSLILQFLPKYDDSIPIEMYSGLRIHTVKNLTLGETFEMLHLGDSKTFDRKKKGDLVESIIGGCILLSQRENAPLFVLYAHALIDYTFYHSSYNYFEKHPPKTSKDAIINDIQTWFKDQITYYRDSLIAYKNDPTNFVIQEQEITIDFLDGRPTTDSNDIDYILNSSEPIDFGVPEFEECNFPIDPNYFTQPM